MINSIVNALLQFLLIFIGSKIANGSWYSGPVTPYKEVAYLRTENLNHITNRGYKIKKIWSICRHGERYPSESILYGMNNILPNIRASSNQCANLNNWRPDDQVQYGGTNATIGRSLTSEGEKTMQQLGSRFYQRFHSILNVTSLQEFTVRATDKYRTQYSAVHFLLGIFDKYSETELLKVVSSDNHTLLNFEKNCLEWRRTVEKAGSDRVKTYEETILSRVYEDLQQHCKFNVTMKKSILLLMYQTCVFETNWNGDSPWCHIFSTEQLAKLLYRHDLKFYLKHGYEYPLNGQIACVLMDDVFKSLFPDDYNDGQSSKNVFLNFAHAKNLLKFITHIHLFDDGKKLDEHECVSIQERQWYTSEMATFAVNLSFVLYEDSTGDPIIVLLFNEKEISIPGCGTWCRASDFKRLYRNKCDWEKLCKPNDKENLKWLRNEEKKKDKIPKNPASKFYR